MKFRCDKAQCTRYDNGTINNTTYSSNNANKVTHETTNRDKQRDTEEGKRGTETVYADNVANTN